MSKLETNNATVMVNDKALIDWCADNASLKYTADSNLLTVDACYRPKSDGCYIDNCYVSGFEAYPVQTFPNTCPSNTLTAYPNAFTTLEYRYSSDDADSSKQSSKSKAKKPAKKPIKAFMRLPELKRFEVHGNTVIAYFADNYQTKATCRESDVFDLQTGLMICYMKKVFGESVKGEIRKVIKKQDESEQKAKQAKLEEAENARKQREKSRKAYEKKLRYKARQELLYQQYLEEERQKLAKEADEQSK